MRHDWQSNKAIQPTLSVADSELTREEYKMNTGFQSACLIMCHKNPNLVNRLISKLQSDDYGCFVRIDSRANFLPKISSVLTKNAISV